METKQIVVNRTGSRSVSSAKSLCGTLVVFSLILTVLLVVLAFISGESALFIIAACCFILCITLSIYKSVLLGLYTIVYIKETEEAVNFSEYQTFGSQEEIDNYNRDCRRHMHYAGEHKEFADGYSLLKSKDNQ